jgi:hypothetical protein
MNQEEKNFCHAVGRIHYYANDALNEFYIEHKDFFEKELLSKNSAIAYDYARTIGQPFPLGESAISRSGEKSYQYANDVLHGPFPIGENSISKNAQYSFYYARDVIKARWEPAEKKLLEKPFDNMDFIISYAADIIKGKWTEAEEFIKNSKSPLRIYRYLVDARKERWEEVEDDVIKNGNQIIEYCQKVIGGRWIEGEKKLLKIPSMEILIKYCKEVLNGRWLDLENKLFENENTEGLFEYAKVVMNGKLPESLHNKVLMMGMVKKDSYLSKYFKAKKYKIGKESKLKVYSTY